MRNFCEDCIAQAHRTRQVTLKYKQVSGFEREMRNAKT